MDLLQPSYKTLTTSTYSSQGSAPTPDVKLESSTADSRFQLALGCSRSPCIAGEMGSSGMEGNVNFAPMEHLTGGLTGGLQPGTQSNAVFPNHFGLHSGGMFPASQQELQASRLRLYARPPMSNQMHLVPCPTPTDHPIVTHLGRPQDDVDRDSANKKRREQRAYERPFFKEAASAHAEGRAPRYPIRIDPTGKVLGLKTKWHNSVRSIAKRTLRWDIRENKKHAIEWEWVCATIIHELDTLYSYEPTPLNPAYLSKYLVGTLSDDRRAWKIYYEENKVKPDDMPEEAFAAWQPHWGSEAGKKQSEHMWAIRALVKQKSSNWSAPSTSSGGSFQQAASSPSFSCPSLRGRDSDQFGGTIVPPTPVPSPNEQRVSGGSTTTQRLPNEGLRDNAQETGIRVHEPPLFLGTDIMEQTTHISDTFFSNGSQANSQELLDTDVFPKSTPEYARSIQGGRSADTFQRQLMVWKKDMEAQYSTLKNDHVQTLSVLKDAMEILSSFQGSKRQQQDQPVPTRPLAAETQHNTLYNDIIPLRNASGSSSQVSAVDSLGTHILTSPESSGLQVVACSAPVDQPEDPTPALVSNEHVVASTMLLHNPNSSSRLTCTNGLEEDLLDEDADFDMRPKRRITRAHAPLIFSPKKTSNLRKKMKKGTPLPVILEPAPSRPGRLLKRHTANPVAVGKPVWIIHPNYNDVVVAYGKSGPSWRTKSHRLGTMCETGTQMVHIGAVILCLIQ